MRAQPGGLALGLALEAKQCAKQRRQCQAQAGTDDLFDLAEIGELGQQGRRYSLHQLHGSALHRFQR
ncbi:hypothetical protein D3C81_1742190 [compost metagenome]